MNRLQNYILRISKIDAFYENNLVWILIKLSIGLKFSKHLSFYPQITTLIQDYQTCKLSFLDGLWMSESPLKYPWLNIVQFHKEFVKFEQGNFFNIRLSNNGQPDSSKSIVFRNFFPNTIDAAWIILQPLFQTFIIRHHIPYKSIF